MDLHFASNCCLTGLAMAAADSCRLLYTNTKEVSTSSSNAIIKLYKRTEQISHCILLVDWVAVLVKHYNTKYSIDFDFSAPTNQYLNKYNCQLPYSATHQDFPKSCSLQTLNCIGSNIPNANKQYFVKNRGKFPSCFALSAVIANDLQVQAISIMHNFVCRQYNSILQ